MKNFVSVEAQTVFGVVIVKDGNASVVRMPTEAELRSGLADWRWDETAGTCLKVGSDHLRFWAEQPDGLYVAETTASGPWQHNGQIRGRIMKVWIALRNDAIQFAMSPEGQAIQARNAALIARAKQINGGE